MGRTKNKILFSFAMLLTTFVVVIFSFISSLAAQSVSFRGGVSIQYFKPNTLENGRTWQVLLLYDYPSYTNIVFDYGKNHPEIIETYSTPGDAYDLGGIATYMDSKTKTIYILSKGEIYANEDCESMFHGCNHITSIKFNNFNTSNVKTMKLMFCWTNSITELDLSGFDTSNVTDMNHMFFRMESLKSLNISSFNVEKVTDMGGMFYACSSLEEFDLSNFKTDSLKITHSTSIQNGAGMFEFCQSLKKLDISNFNIKNVSSLEAMFNGCSSLTELNLSSFNTANVTNMYSTFRSCKSLKELDLSSFNTANVTYMHYMFHSCENLERIYVSNLWTNDAVFSSGYSGTFSGCTSLVGESGWGYNDGYTSATYARVGTSSERGYLTLKK